MAEVDALGPRAADAVPFVGIQPGGGWGIAIERGARRLRRLWLRLARRRYLRERAASRRGACARCVHDPLDPRDQKLDRNQCGYRWSDEDVVWQPVLGLARAGVGEVVGSLVLAAALSVAAVVVGARHPLGWSLLAPAIAVTAFALHFFRDPPRIAPAVAGAILAPSDGVVTHVHEIDDPDFRGGRAVRVSVYLSPYDVHLNRAPVSARVTDVRYFPGRFVNARHRDCARVNEQLWLDLVDDAGRALRIKQISGALARRLVCWPRVGDDLVAGARYGMIKYGSRADVLLEPGPGLEVVVAVGQRVVAGETVLARREPA